MTVTENGYLEEPAVEVMYCLYDTPSAKMSVGLESTRKDVVDDDRVREVLPWCTSRWPNDRHRRLGSCYETE